MLAEIKSSLATIFLRKSPNQYWFGYDRAQISHEDIEPEVALRATAVSNSILYQSNQIASLDWKSEDARVSELLDRPNAAQNRFDLFFSMTFDLLLHGRTYLLNDPILGLIPFNPREIRRGLNKDNEPVFFITPFESPVPINSGEYAKDRIIVINDIPTSKGIATSRTALCAGSIRIVLDIDEAVRDLAVNGPVAGVQINSPRDENDTWSEQVSKAVAKKFGSKGTKRGGVAAFDNGVTMSPFGPALNVGGDSLTYKHDEEYKICSAFGTSPDLVGVSGSNVTYSNLSLQHSSAYRDGLFPLCDRMKIALSNGLGAEVYPDLTKIVAGDLPTAARTASELFTSGVLKRGAAARLVGETCDPADDVYCSNPQSPLRSDDSGDPNRPRRANPEDNRSGQLRPVQDRRAS